jgi:hypothetical protein
MKIQNFSFKAFIVFLERFLFGFGLFGYGCISSFISESAVSRNVTIPYRVIILLLSLIIIFVNVFNITVRSKKEYQLNSEEHHVNNQGKNPKFYWIPKYILICFVLVYSFKLLEYTVYDASVLVKNPEEYQLYWFGVCLIPALSFLTVKYCQSQKYLFSAYIFIYFSSLISVFSLNKSNSLIDVGRFSREGFNPISLGSDGISLVILSIFIFTMNKNTLNNKRVLYFICFFGIFLGSFIAFLSGSKGPILSLFICLIINLMFAKYNHESFFNKKIITGYIILIPLIVLLIVIITNIDQTQLALLNRIYSSFEARDASTLERVNLIDEAIPLIMSKPIFGNSIEVPGEKYVHNLIIDSFLSTGISGGLFFTFIYVYGIVKSIRILKNHYSEWGWLGMIYIQYSVAILMSGSLYASNGFWYLIFCLVGLKMNGKKKT